MVNLRLAYVGLLGLAVTAGMGPGANPAAAASPPPVTFVPPRATMVAPVPTFTIIAPTLYRNTGAPTVTSTTPTSLTYDSWFTITGNNLLGATATLTWRNQSTPPVSATVKSNGGTQLQVWVPEQAGGGGLTPPPVTINLTTSAGSTAAGPYPVNRVPKITGYTVIKDVNGNWIPGAVPGGAASQRPANTTLPGDLVQINGLNLDVFGIYQGTGPAQSLLQVGPVTGPMPVASIGTTVTAIQFVMPSQCAGTNPLTMVLQGGTLGGMYQGPALTCSRIPTLSGFSGGLGNNTATPGGATLYVTGVGLSLATGVSSIGGGVTSNPGCTDTQCPVPMVPSASGTSYVTVNVPAFGMSIQSPQQLTIVQAPLVRTVNPICATPGTQVFLAGSNMQNAQAGAIQLGAQSLGFNVTNGTTPSNDQVWFQIPAGSPVGATKVTFTSHAGNSASTSFYVAPAGSMGGTPTITSFSPTSGAMNTVITINGTNLCGTQASINMQGANLLTQTPTSMTVQVNQSPGKGGPVMVGIPNGATSAPAASQFTCTGCP